jgi:hypothetical protein
MLVVDPLCVGLRDFDGARSGVPMGTEREAKETARTYTPLCLAMAPDLDRGELGVS